MFVFFIVSQLNDCIQSMRQCNSGKLTSHQEVLIKRYHEIHFDYNTEFKNTSVGHDDKALSQRFYDMFILLIANGNICRQLFSANGKVWNYFSHPTACIRMTKIPPWRSCFVSGVVLRPQ